MVSRVQQDLIHYLLFTIDKTFAFYEITLTW